MQTIDYLLILLTLQTLANSAVCVYLITKEMSRPKPEAKRIRIRKPKTAGLFPSTDATGDLT